MSIIKKYDVGEINVTLPTCNYIHRLPLISFGDIHGGFTLSLCFNYVMKNEGTNTFGIAAGFKLNVDKRIIFENGAPAKFRDENGDLILLNGSDGLYGFEDNSGRILRPFVAGGYDIEYPDFSKEQYTSTGCLRYVFNKNIAQMIEVIRDDSERIAAVSYIGGQRITVSYGSGGTLSSVSYGGKTVSFTYTSDGVRATDSNGVAFVMSSSGWNYSCTASSTEGEDNISYVTKIERVASSSSLKCSYIDRGTVTDAVTYDFCNGLYAGRSSARIIVTDKKGARTVLYYNADKRLLYSHEDAADAGFMDGKFTGTVDIFGTLDSDEDVKMLCAYPNDSDINVYLADADRQRWSADVSQMYLNVKGYYVLTGWIKFKDGMGQAGRDKLYISSGSAALCSFMPGYTVTGGWVFFAYRFYFGANLITVFPDDWDAVELRDIRLTFKPDRILADNKSDYLALSEDVLIYHGDDKNEYIPLSELEVSYETPYNPRRGIIHFADFVRYMLNEKKNSSLTNVEVYFNNCKNAYNVRPENFIIYKDGKAKSPSQFYPANRRYTPSGVVTTVFKDDVENEFLVCETLDPDGNVIASATYDNSLNIKTSTDDKGLETVYRWNSSGLLTLCVDYSRGNHFYSYDKDSGGNPRVTFEDEFSRKTIYTYDSVWGHLKSVVRPWGETETYEADTDGCAVEKKSFTVSGSSLTYGYSAGKLSRVQGSGLPLGFLYSGGNLSAFTIGGNVFEEYDVTDTRTDSYYPTKASPLYSESVTYDKYGRVTAVIGDIENTYDIDPITLTAGAYSVAGHDNGNGKLATSNDLKTGNVTKYAYSDGRLSRKGVFNSSGSKTAEEIITYDDIGRVYKDEYVSGGKTVRDVYTYETATTDVNSDNRVNFYSFEIGDSSYLTASYEYDVCKRIKKRTVHSGRYDACMNYKYNNTRLFGVTHTGWGGGILHDFCLGTDEAGRIITEMDLKTGDGRYANSYEYDKLGQLTRENNNRAEKTFTYEYNSTGGLLKVKTYAFDDSDGAITGAVQSEETFGYSVLGRLTNYNGKTLKYDNYGCLSEYDGWKYSWSKGRLSSIYMDAAPSLGRAIIKLPLKAYYFTYNGVGQRTQKKYIYFPKAGVAQGVLIMCTSDYEYDLNGRLMNETRTYKYNDDTTFVRKMRYIYEGAEVSGFTLTSNGKSESYHYLKNPLGDVIAILNNVGTTVAEYRYDAYGNCLSVSGSNDEVASCNPFRYRSYYYDDDTGLYYLNARYYNPKLRRFISPDNSAYLDTGSPQGLNLYAYCGNDPVSHSDPSGRSWLLALIAGAVIGFAISAGTSVFIQYYENEGDWSKFNQGKMWYDGAFGAISGLLAATGIGPIASAVVGAILGGVSSIGNDIIFNDGNIRWDSAAIAVIVGAIGGALSGAGADYIGDGKQLTKFRNSRDILQKTIANNRVTTRVIARQASALSIHTNKLVISGARYLMSHVFTTTSNGLYNAIDWEKLWLYQPV